MKAKMWNRKYWIETNKIFKSDYEKMLKDAGFSIISQQDHKFTPYGYALLYLLGESHLAIHTFPEDNKDYVELTSCNENMLLAFHNSFMSIAKEKGIRVKTPQILPLSTDSFIDEGNHVVYEAYPSGTSWVCKYDKILAHKKTKYQEFLIIDGPQGKSLWIDGCLQSKENNEFVYHEMLVHPAMMSHRNISKVLILGGGEGAVLRELVRYPEIEKIVMVDIDGELVNACKKHLLSWHDGAFNDSRVEVIIDDAFDYIEKCKQCYDLTILDLPAVGSDRTQNLNIVTQQYISQSFYKTLYSILSDVGVIVSYFGDYFNSDITRKRVRDTAKKVFPEFWIYRVNGILLKMFIASKHKIDIYCVNQQGCIDLSSIAGRINNQLKERLNSSLCYYNGLEHIASFALSNNMKEWME